MLENHGIFGSILPGKNKGLALFAAILFLGSVTSIQARPTTNMEALKIVENWLLLSDSPLATVMEKTVDESITYYDDAATPIFHVVDLLPDGFVIVAADDLVEPIIGFLPHGDFNPSLDNPLGALVTNDLAGRIATVKDMEEDAQRNGVEFAPISQMSEASRKWQLLSSEYSQRSNDFGLSSITDVRVAPLVSTTWSQSTACSQYVYNYYTPNHYVSGCVATAQAQLMRYYSFPTVGPGTPSFWIEVNDVPTTRSLRGGDGSGGAYNWGAMVASPGCATTLAQRQAIGALTYDTGVSVGMNYTSSGSGADTLYTAVSLVDTFGYSQAIRGYNSLNTIPVAGLTKMINPNLDASHPVILGITGSAGGHAIVADGYGYNLSTLYHHLNMGWAGYDNGWYNLPTIDTSSYDFNSVYKCVYNVFQSGTGEIISGRVLDSKGNPLSGVAINASRTGGGSYSATTNAKGIYALEKVPSSSTYTISASRSGYSIKGQTVSTGKSSDYSNTSGNLWNVSFTATVQTGGGGGGGIALPALNILLGEKK